MIREGARESRNSPKSAKFGIDKKINRFERYLTVWVALCIVAGVLVWVMIIPMLLKIDFGALLATLLLVKIANAAQGWHGKTSEK